MNIFTLYKLHRSYRKAYRQDYPLTQIHQNGQYISVSVVLTVSSNQQNPSCLILLYYIPHKHSSWEQVLLNWQSTTGHGDVHIPVGHDSFEQKHGRTM